jgi:hypothetical protein
MCSIKIFWWPNQMVSRRSFHASSTNPPACSCHGTIWLDMDIIASFYDPRRPSLRDSSLAIAHPTRVPSIQTGHIWRRSCCKIFENDFGGKLQRNLCFVCKRSTSWKTVVDASKSSVAVASSSGRGNISYRRIQCSIHQNMSFLHCIRWLYDA